MEPALIASDETRDVYDVGRVAITAKGLEKVLTAFARRRIEAISLSRDGASTVRVRALVCPTGHGRSDGAYCSGCGAKLVSA